MEMVKVLIVDDEEITREGLKACIPWEELGMTVAAVAEDGVEGLAAALAVMPDIALCDVRMPRMDGIGLARELKDKLPRCKIIFLSGYSDLDYLKSAIQLQAVDYVEKPADLDRLQSVLAQAAEACRNERKTLQRMEDMERQLIKARPYWRGKAFETLLSGAEPAEELERQWSELLTVRPGAGSYVCCMIKTEDKRNNEAILAKLEKMIPAYGLRGVCGEYDRHLAAVFELEGGKDEESVALAMNALTAYGRDELQTGLTVGIGGTAGSLSAVAASAGQAAEALQLHFYRGWGVSIPYDTASRGVKPKRIYEKDVFIRFEKHLQRNEFEEAALLVRDMGSELKRLEAPGIGSIRKRLLKLYIILSKEFPEAVAELENDELWKLFADDPMFSILRFIEEQLEGIRNGLAMLGTQPDKTVIREAVAYIHQHYMEECPIDAIAGHVFLTPTYFCLLFKKELGLSVGEYLTQVRIEKAKQLLRDRSLKLYEISLKVGYSDPNYFAKVFRKLTGMKPSEYREARETAT